MRFQGSFDLPRGKTLCIVFIAQIEWVAKIGFLIGNDLETSEVLYSALLNPKNADFKCKGSGLVWIIQSPVYVKYVPYQSKPFVYGQ